MSGKVDEVAVDNVTEDVNKDAVSSQGKKKDKKKTGKDVKQTKDDIKEKKISKHVAKIKEDLARQREEEERLRREQEEELQRLENERLREEAILAREKELKLKKKLKEKERKQRLKEEGKLLTDKQKEDRRKVMELLQARGIEIPDDKSELKKRPQYGKLKKKTVQIKKEDETVDTQEEIKTENLENSTEELSCWEMLADTHLKSPSEESSEETEDYLIIDQQPSHSDHVETSVANDDDLPEEEKARLIELAKLRIKVVVTFHFICEFRNVMKRTKLGVVSSICGQELFAFWVMSIQERLKSWTNSGIHTSRIGRLVELLNRLVQLMYHLKT